MQVRMTSWLYPPTRIVKSSACAAHVVKHFKDVIVRECIRATTRSMRPFMETVNGRDSSTEPCGTPASRRARSPHRLSTNQRE